MSGEISTIQSLKAVDAWIDVINANINGGVRTAFKSSRLKFSGSNTDIQHTGNSTSLPLQFAEPSLTTANTVIDFTQGAITASTENTHLAIQGEGFFLLISPEAINTAAGASFGTTLPASAGSRLLLTRDGEFRTNQYGFLVNAAGYYLVTYSPVTASPQLVPYYGGGAANGFNTGIRPIYNDVDNTGTAPTGGYVRLTSFLANSAIAGGPSGILDAAGTNLWNVTSLVRVANAQNLQYSRFGSTVFDMGYQPTAGVGTIAPTISLNYGTTTTASVLSKSLEASNSSMTQSVPELSLAQKLFSALTKVLQTKQTNVDGVLNLVR